MTNASVFILTKIYNFDMNSHEHDLFTGGVYTSADDALKDAKIWLSARGKLEQESFQDDFDKNHRRILFMSTRTGTHAFTVQEHTLIEKVAPIAKASPMLIDDFVNVTKELATRANHPELLINNIERLGELAKQ